MAQSGDRNAAAMARPKEPVPPVITAVAFQPPCRPQDMPKTVLAASPGNGISGKQHPDLKTREMTGNNIRTTVESYHR